jgi:hypothetical protein
MKQRHHLYIYPFIVLLPILLLLYLNSVEMDVYASPRQQLASLTVYTVGDGTVAKDPDQGSYDYGDVVTLTATADLGWMFSEWSGDLASSDNPETLTMDSDKTITATFTLDEYTLTVSTVGNGTVDKDPDQATYHYNDVVTLTATADPGWVFADWSGALSSTANPENVTITGDTVVTATFSQVYTLTVSTVGDGMVDKDPDQPSYQYGDVVTLTATADPGWMFSEWSGDLAGSDNPETLTVDSDKTVTATFQTLSDIDVWYGSHQVFGELGNPQRWVNILGNVSDPDGVISLTYSLNGEPESPLSIGPEDNPRLAAEGDFNIEIALTDLDSGLNPVVITATDGLDHQTVETVTVEYVSGHVWPETYSIDWSTVTAIPDVAQIVDGLWTLEADSIRPAILGYDRLVAIGDKDPSWDEYEITVPVTIHGIEPAGYGPPGNGPGVGIFMRWDGHYDSGDSQPRLGWYPLGALGWYRWRNDTLGDRLRMLGNYGALIAEDTSGRKLSYGVCYLFKMHVETVPGQGGLYALKVWEEGQSEPSAWDLVAQEGLSDPQYGSLMLVAHYVDASFGDVTITPGPFADVIQPILSNIQVTSGETWATITWTTNEPATSTVSYGPSSAYENGSVTDSASVTEHTITLTDLFQGALYHYRIASADGSGNVAQSTDLTFRTTGVASSIVSDDFNTCDLDDGLWEWTDPRGDASYNTTGTFTEDAWLSISVPAGTSHDVWTGGNFAPRIMQPANNVDFEIEVKFESVVSQEYQMQGVLVEQDSDDFLRFDFHSVDSSTRIFAASFTSGSPPSQKILQVITGGAPLYMRVRRTGDQWALSYSYDGENWTTSGSFAHALSVTKVGAFVGNAGSSPPAHTGSIDYFFNSAAPIVPEDGDRNTLTINTVGNGTVTKDPDEDMYDCYDEVTLTATADPDWTFRGWSGDLSGSTNPVNVEMTGSRVISATFTQGDYEIFLPLITVQY